MPDSHAFISNSRLLSYSEDSAYDFFQVSQADSEAGVSLSASFYNSGFSLPENLFDTFRKCAEYLAVWKIRVNTHTHTHTHILTARQYTNYFLNTSHLRRVRFPKNLSFARFYPHIYMPPPPLEGTHRYTRRRSMPEHGVSVSTYSADAFFSTRQ